MPTDSVTLQRCARAMGVAMLLSIIFGGLGEAILPGRIIVAGDPAATATNLAQSGAVRLSFAAYLVEGICDVTLAGLFYILLRDVNRPLALLSACFGLAAMITFASAQSSFFSASLMVGESAGMGTFSPEQRAALAMLAIRKSEAIATLFLALYGIATMLRGYLLLRSGYLPKLFGVLFFIGGAGFFLRTATYLLVPAYSSQVFLYGMALGGIPLMAWLLIRGVSPAPVGHR